MTISDIIEHSEISFNCLTGQVNEKHLGGGEPHTKEQSEKFQSIIYFLKTY